MPREIEKKFIVINKEWGKYGILDPSKTEKITQGYVTFNSGSVHLHISNHEEKACLILEPKKQNGKGDSQNGQEEPWEFITTLEHAREMKKDGIVGSSEKNDGEIDLNEATVRVRISTPPIGKEKAYLTVKSKRDPKTSGVDRGEWEYPINVRQAKAMLKSACEYSLEKTRYHIPPKDRKWDVKDTEWIVDVFDDAPLRGIALAEIEFKKGVSTDIPHLPPFVSTESETTNSELFGNRALARALAEYLANDAAGVETLANKALKKVKDAVAAVIPSIVR